MHVRTLISLLITPISLLGLSPAVYGLTILVPIFKFHYTNSAVYSAEQCETMHMDKLWVIRWSQPNQTSPSN
jgi:hypothetical protein